MQVRIYIQNINLHFLNELKVYSRLLSWSIDCLLSCFCCM